MFLFKKARSRIVLCSMVVIMLCGMLSINISSTLAAPPEPLPPANPLLWVDAATLSYGGRQFKETNINDDNWHFNGNNPDNGCPEEIKGLNYNTVQGPYKEQKVTWYKQKRVESGVCKSDGNQDLTLLALPAGYNTTFTWIDDHNIKSVDGQRQFSLNDDTKAFVSLKDTSSCKDTMLVGTDKSNLILKIRSDIGGGEGATTSLRKKYGTRIEDAGDANSGWPFFRNIDSEGDKDDCHNAIPRTITVANPENSIKKGIPKESGTLGGTDEDTSPDCDSKGTSLSWIFCPMINSLAKAADGIFDKFIVPLLKTESINLNDPEGDPSGTYKIWSNFRIIGNIILIGALLVAIFGQAIGGGLVDAYTVKKIVPRLLTAAILLNLSIYIVALLVDFTNVLGKGINELIYAPFGNAGEFNLKFSGGFSGAALLGTAVGVWAIAAWGGALFGFIGLFVVLPALLAFLGVIITLLIRRGIIMLLIILAPVAFALYVLPNTEQYFKKWWSLLFKTLLIYPIIAVIFAIADVLSVTIKKTAETSGLTEAVGSVLSIAALVLPLFLIPFAFKLAGGAIATLYGALAGWNGKGVQFLKGNPNDPYSRGNMAKRRMGNETLSARERMVNRGINMQKKGRLGGFSKLMGGRLAAVAGGSNYEVRRSLKNAEAAELIKNQTATGGDSLVRALFAEKNAEGKWIGTGGTEYSDYEVKKAQQLFGRDQSLYQAGLTYEIGKAGDDTELQKVKEVNARNMGRLGFRNDQDSIWLGAAWNHVNDRRELKHEKFAEDGKYKRNRYNFTREVAENVGSWPLSNMRTSAIKALREDHKWAKQVQAAGDDSQLFAKTKSDGKPMNPQERADHIAETRQQANEVIRFTTATAQSLKARSQTGGGYALVGEEEQVPVSQSGGAGLVSAELDGFVRDVLPPSPPRAEGGGGGGGGITIPPGGYTGGRG